MKYHFSHLLIIAFLINGCTTDHDTKSFHQYVDPFIGTDMAEGTEGMATDFTRGNVHPGPLVPWGMVSFAPRNSMITNSDPNCPSAILSEIPSGYKKNGKHIYGFSHTLISGAGCPELGNIVVMPTVGGVSSDFRKNRSEYSNERASAGFYGVTLTDHGIDVEATVTKRSTISKYTFEQETDSASIIVDLFHSQIAASDAFISKVSDTEIEGWTSSGCFCGSSTSYRVHFVAQFNRPFKSYEIYSNEGFLKGAEELNQAEAGMYMRFDAGPDSPLLMKTAISYVSIDNARLNLESELPEWDFDVAQVSAQNEWNKQLSRIKVEGGTDSLRTIFYTALYHSLIHPNIVSDVNGEYVAMETKEIKTLGEGRRYHYTIFSLWDTYRTLHPLLTLAYPEMQLDMVKTMIDMYETSGFLPKWELMANETYVMVGDPACPVITDTYVKGLRDFDVMRAFEAMRKSSDLIDGNPIRPANRAYTEFGFIPFNHPDADKIWGPVSTTLELNFADWSIAQLAGYLGFRKEYEVYYAKSMGYKKLYDKESLFLAPKNTDGSIIENFDPDTLRGSRPGDWESGGPGYVEGNAWQYNFFVPHDIKGLAELMGRDAFVERLQSCFDVEGRFMLFNEPDMAYPYLFNYIEGEEWRTQLEARNTMEIYFDNTPAGLPGNDDCGTISAWFVFSALGFYPDCPGRPIYQIGSPLFDRATISLNTDFYNGKEFMIRTKNNSKKNLFIQSIALNGFEYNSYQLNHFDIVNGGVIDLEMGPNPK